MNEMLIPAVASGEAEFLSRNVFTNQTESTLKIRIPLLKVNERYICSGAVIPKTLNPFRSTTLVARQRAKRAFVNAESSLKTLRSW